MLVGARQSFIFFRQNNCFSGNNGALSKFLYEILYQIKYYQIVKILVLKTQFYIIRASHLKVLSYSTTHWAAQK